MLSGNKNIQENQQLKTIGTFLLAVVLVLIITPLFQAGSFIDANLYKTVAANFEEPGTTFWNMKFSNTSMSFFCEQPPLYLYLLGLFYQIFGIHLLTDRLFTLLQLIVFLFLVYGICKKLFAEKTNFFFLLNLFFLLSVQVLCWTFAQQVIESLVLVFAALALYIYLLYLEKPVFRLAIIFSIAVVLLFLTKGFQSCFVLLLPIGHAVISGFEKNKVRFVFVTVLLSLSSIGGLLYLYQPAEQWFVCYYKARLVLTMENVGATTNNHFALLFEALIQNILLLLMFLLMYGVLRRKNLWQAADQSGRALGLSLLLTALGGILPFMLSLVQRAFYPVPAYLFLVLFFTYAFRGNWILFLEKLKPIAGRTGMRYTAYGILLAALIYFVLRVPSYKREQDLEEDVEKISAYFSKGDTIGIHPDLWNNFNLHALLYRKKKVSLSVEKSSNGYLLLPQGKTPAKQNGTFHKIQLQTRELQLYFVGLNSVSY